MGLTSVGDLHTGGVTFAHRRLLGDMANRGELSLRLDYYVAPNGPGDEVEQLRIAAEEGKQLPSNDMFRFAGFAETLTRVPATAMCCRTPKDLQWIRKQRRIS